MKKLVDKVNNFILLCYVKYIIFSLMGKEAVDQKLKSMKLKRS